MPLRQIPVAIRAVLGLLAVTVLCYVWLRPDIGGTSPELHTLRFEVCNGFANQRLSIVYGLVIAKAVGRTAVVPYFILNGSQSTLQAKTAWNSVYKPLSEVYDIDQLVHGAARAGISILPTERAPPVRMYEQVSITRVPDPIQFLISVYSDTPHVAIGCPLFKLHPDRMSVSEEVVWATLDALHPSKANQRHIDGAVAALKAASATQQFNFLHLRLETDWIDHCVRWEKLTDEDGLVRDNCFNNTHDVDVQLVSKGFEKAVPLYVASSWSQARPADAQAVLARLKERGFKVVTRDEIMPEAAAWVREEAAFVDFFIAMRAHRFIGNSVSTFSALLILERRRRHLWAAYYNGGNIPFAAALPLFQLPWVFTYNSWSDTYDYMLKAAVRSAAAVGGLAPWCVYMGNATAPIYGWLREHNVRVIEHEPAWIDSLLLALGGTDRASRNLVHSHLFSNEQMQVGTWQRIDIPILPQLQEHEYVLFTDSDVFFRKRFTLDDFGLPLPQTIAMAAERHMYFPYNAGVMLMNLPKLRATYTSFISFVFGNKHAMFFPEYGPGDQGALNQFYEKDVRSSVLPQLFNAKPYHNFSRDAFLVHFHGPKPHDYAAYVDTGECGFLDLCDMGLRAAFCSYYQEWYKFFEEGDTSLRIAIAACAGAPVKAAKRSAQQGIGSESSTEHSV